MSGSNWDPQQVQANLLWLQDHPWFEEKPASILEFLGPGYLNIESKVREGVKKELIEIFGQEVNGHRIAKYRWGMFTGAIGIGKTTMASIVIPYMVHWVLCLKDPQDFYDLLPGSRIAFMQMSTSEDQAIETVFGDIKARVEYCAWFQDRYPMDPAYKKQIRFAKNIWILPGSSMETSFEGYNILAGILDEADSHKKTKDKDYAEVGWDTINGRIDSRFQDRGFLLTVGQMKSSSGFAAAKYKELTDDKDNAHTVRMTIWESLGWKKFSDANGNHLSFWYDSKRKEIISEQAAKLLGFPAHVMEIPSVYEKNFRNNPEKALRDLAGIPPASGDAFISLTYRLEEARERWVNHYDVGSPVDTNPSRPRLESWFQATNSMRHHAHMDIAYSGDGDAAGIAMGHVDRLVEIDGEEKPYIVIDCAFRFKVGSGQEIMLSDLRQVIYELRDERHFKLKSVSMDGFQSVDTQQQFRKRRIKVDYLSIDKSKAPYEDLRDAIYENRIEWPPYMTHLSPGDSAEVDIIFKEMSELVENDKKIDHPAGGSKDVADAIAGVVHTLMGDRSYRRGVGSDRKRELVSDDEFQAMLKNVGGEAVGKDFSVGIGGSDRDFRAPLPPSISSTGMLPVPQSLRPGKDR